MKRKLWPADLIAEIRASFSYDPETGHITRKVSRVNRAVKNPAGLLSPSGYLQTCVRCNGKAYNIYNHRLAYFLLTGEQPDEVDHRDGNRSNNRADNLRAATHQQNAFNRMPRRELPIGIHVKRRYGRTFFRACITINGKQATADKKHLFDAIAWRDSKAKTLFGAFASQ